MIGSGDGPGRRDHPVMHEGEVAVDATVVRSLLESQFPAWADLPIEPFRSAGTDNAIFRVGEHLAVRMPRIESAISQVVKERRWLPQLAPRLPVRIPEPLATGSPGNGYPWPWSVYRWIGGEVASIDRIADRDEVAVELGRFVASLQLVDLSGGPAPGSHNSFRGAPLEYRDGATRQAIATLDDTYEPGALTAAWDAALQTPAWPGPGVWLHGDLHAGNLLAHRGRLRAVIDFGCLARGDPACDLMVAWTYLPAEVRRHFRAQLEVDDHTWGRGRGWALSMGVIALPYYRDTNPVLAGIARGAIDAVLDDPGVGPSPR
jgi:aminoglycoside phosphotransferase (APT) family kinase protein